MNKQLFSVAEYQAQTLETLPTPLIEQIKTAKQALVLSVSLSGATHESIANEIDKPRETLTRFLNCNGGLNFKHFVKLINATGNLVILQFLAYYFGYELKPIDQKAKRKQELLAELQLLEA